MSNRMERNVSKQKHDTFPIRLKGNRRAFLMLPVDLTKEDAELIVKHIQFIAECSADHASELKWEESSK